MSATWSEAGRDVCYQHTTMAGSGSRSHTMLYDVEHDDARGIALMNPALS